MGWASGSSLLDEVADATLHLIPASKREKVAEMLIESFEGMDCDTINECENKYIAKVYNRMCPDEDEVQGDEDDDV